MIATYLNGHDVLFSITLQSLEEIELCVPAVGVKIWCLCVLFVTLRPADALFVQGGIL